MPIADPITTNETTAMPIKKVSLDMYCTVFTWAGVGVGAIVGVGGTGVGVSVGFGVSVGGGVGVAGAFTSTFTVLLPDAATLASLFDTVVLTMVHLPAVLSVLETVKAPVV